MNCMFLLNISEFRLELFLDYWKHNIVELGPLNFIVTCPANGSYIIDIAVPRLTKAQKVEVMLPFVSIDLLNVIISCKD
jgi:hypothetical protein